jgi:hypothetical protein
MIVALCHYLVTLMILKRNAYPMRFVCFSLVILIAATAVMPLIYELHFLIRYAILLATVAAVALYLLRTLRRS